MRKKRFTLGRAIRILARTLLIIIGIGLFLTLLIQLPFVQNIARKEAVSYLEKKLNTKIEIGHLSIAFPNRITLDDVYVEDRNRDTLLSGGSLRVNMSILKLIFRNEVDIKSIKLENIVAKVKRELPDTAFNFQFILDSFSTSNAKTADTNSVSYAIPKIELDNIRFQLKDTILGLDMAGYLEHLDTRLDEFDARKKIYGIPLANIRGLTAYVYQSKPLATPDPQIVDDVEAISGFSTMLDIGETNLQNIKIDFRNNISAFYSTLEIGDFRVKVNDLDLENRVINLDELSLGNTTAVFQLGKKAEARIVEKEVEQEIESQADAGWRITANKINLDSNTLSFDNENHARINYGMDYAHLKLEAVTISIENFIMTRDSIGGRINRAHFREQSGFELQQLNADALYANTVLYLRDLYLKTPGTELKRYAEMHYASYEDLARRFSNTRMDVDIDNSYVKVSDILTFAPGLRRQAAFSNPNDTWYIDAQGNGTLGALNINNLSFSGLTDTRIDVSGTLALDKNSNNNGTLHIRRLHTNQSDIALFTGSRLSNAGLNLPETFDASGTLTGSIRQMNTDLAINSNAGALQVNGSFSNLNDPRQFTYNANVNTRSLNIGSILRNKELGTMSADLALSGQGVGKGNLNTNIKGTIHSIDYNNYTYRNIHLDGNINGSALNVKTDINDPNIALNGEFNGILTETPSFRFKGFIDSLKLQPLHFTAQPVVLRGRIDASVPVFGTDYLEADVLMSDVLLVSSSQRLALDTIQFTAGRNDSTQFMRLSSDVANANLSGQYRFKDLPYIFTNSLEPYFKTGTATSTSALAPYNISFNADIANAPVIADLVPGLRAFEPIHISGTARTGEGIQANATTAYINYNGNEIRGLNLIARTTSNGLELSGDAQRITNGTIDLYHTSITATALNNTLDFRLDIDDPRGATRYLLSGILTQPSTGTYALSLKQDSLLLNYQAWTVSPGNSLTFNGRQITANNFTLQRGPEQIALQTSGELLNVGFTNFQLSTITAFLKSDTLLANGAMNGTVSFRNILQQPVFTSDLAITDLSIRGDTLGNAIIKVDNQSGNRYNTNATITGRGNDVSLTGSFAPQGSSDIALDLDLAIRQLELSTIDGALGSFFQNSSGNLSGNISINGSLNQPLINGPVRFNNASFAFTLLGSRFRIDKEELIFTENGIWFDNFRVRDTSNNILLLNGRVLTRDLTHYTFDLDVDADNFRLLHSTKKQNKLYYGDLVITTDVHVSGTDASPVIDGILSVNDGTNLTVVIPQRQPGVMARDGIIEFADFDNPANDSLFRQNDSLNVSAIRGLNITANILIQKEAVFNIVLDEANGDFLSIQGEAQLTSGVDPSGKITLVGNYVLDRGAYEISFNFLRRRFEIEKGSSIEWYNEPTKANVNVHAVYIANTSPIDLVQQQVTGATPEIRNTYLQKLPFEVHLDLKGELLQPQVAFDIQLPSNRGYGVSNDIITHVDTRLAQLRTDPGETNKQVFALLLLNRFVGENPLESSTDYFSASTYARHSVSRLLTDQLNRLASGLIDGVDLTFDLVSTEDYTTGELRNRTDLNVGLSKQLLNERLTVAVGTNFEIEGSTNTKKSASSAIGNVSVDYAISRDKRYMIRFYRKSEYQGVVDGYVIESGLSFMISVDFDKFKQLITRRKKQVVEGVDKEAIR